MTRKYRLFSLFLLFLAFSAYALSHLKDDAFLADVYVWFPDGNIKKVSPQEDGIYYKPHIHPEGTHVIFFGNEKGPPRLWKVDLSTYETVALTSPEFGARQPSFSFDGKQIAFASDMNSGQSPELVRELKKNGHPPKDQITHLYVMNANGENVRQITFGLYKDQRPCFSPDGETIAFVSNRGGGTRLWKVAVNKKGEPKPLQAVGYGYRPCFSVDGKWIFFFTIVNGRHQLCKMPATGGEITLLDNDNRGMSHSPFAQMNGEYLLMHSTRGGRFEIWELPLDGSLPRKKQPPKFNTATHATISKNGIIAFDVSRWKWPRRTASELKWMIYSLIN